MRNDVPWLGLGKIRCEHTIDPHSNQLAKHAASGSFSALSRSEPQTIPFSIFERTPKLPGLIEEAEPIAGVRATTFNGPLEVRANRVVGADGRNSAGSGGRARSVLDRSIRLNQLIHRV